jgi:hypothetical protein
VYESLVTGVPDFPMNFQHRWAHSLSGLSPMVRISATCPINERSSFRREIADRDSVEQDFYVLENSDSPSSDSLRDYDMCPPEINSCAAFESFESCARSPDLAVARFRFPSRTDPTVLTPSV